MGTRGGPDRSLIARRLSWATAMSGTIYVRAGLSLARLGRRDVSRAAALAAAAFDDVQTGDLVEWELSDHYDRVGDAPFPEQRSSLMVAEYYFLVQDGSDEPLGMTGLYRYAEMNPELFGLGWFCIADSCRRRGYGRSLLETTMRLAVSYGARRLMIETSPGLKAAISLYRSAGFQENGRVPDYYAPGTDLLLFSRPLVGVDPL
jgi:ribosomal protein S18 acetylase RimI-like enzyme